MFSKRLLAEKDFRIKLMQELLYKGALQHKQALNDLRLQHDARVKDLKDEIYSLRQMVFPASRPSFVPSNHLEADALLSGHQDQIRMTPEEMEREEAIQNERNAILGGTY